MDQETRLRKAKAILEDELFNEAFAILREELLQRWEHSGSTETEARESIWLGLQLLIRVRRHFESIIETGEMAKLRDKNNPFI